MSDSLTVEFLQTVRAVGIDTPGAEVSLQGAVMARVYPVPKGRGKPIISLVGTDFPDAARQVALWMEAGRPSMSEAVAGASKETT